MRSFGFHVEFVSEVTVALYIQDKNTKTTIMGVEGCPRNAALPRNKAFRNRLVTTMIL